MRLKRNAFYTFALIVYAICLFFALSTTLQSLGEGQEYPYLLKGEWLIAILAVSCLSVFAGAVWFRLEVTKRLEHSRDLSRLAELFLGITILLGGFILRVNYIRTMPMEPVSDYRTYYEVADYIRRGTLIEEAQGYCDYISMFPHVYGYPAILSIAFSLFGTSVSTALYFNLAAMMISCVLVWILSRMIAGKAAGILSLAIMCFFPSTILYSNFVASEPMFTLFLLIAMVLFTLTMKQTAAKEKHPWIITIELVLVGVTLAIGSFVRPMALIYLVSIGICLFSTEEELSDLPKNDIPLGVRAVNRGWKRFLIIFAVYFLLNKLLTFTVSYNTNRELAGGSASFGYNLLVGLNLQSFGGWNEEDAQYLYDALEETGSGAEAQLICRDMAVQRLLVDPRALGDLFIHKYEVLWGNDDYGASWNILFMDQQSNLTKEREAYLYQMMDVSDFFYLFVLLASGLAGVIMVRKVPNTSYSFVLMFCGTVALHLLVENQNRYHYHTLPILAIMTGVFFYLMMERVQKIVLAQKIEKEHKEAEEKAAKERIERIRAEEKKIEDLRAAALHAQFDMGPAIRDGHVRVVMSQSAAKSHTEPKPRYADDHEAHLSERKKREEEPAENKTVKETAEPAASESMHASLGEESGGKTEAGEEPASRTAEGSEGSSLKAEDEITPAPAETKPAEKKKKKSLFDTLQTRKKEFVIRDSERKEK
ncbi:MAG: glycosyltransferase family 39 protein [Solobacterium sp.]|nr:glycosyltransferase family 39 protein [Solobacterium sp.]